MGIVELIGLALVAAGAGTLGAMLGLGGGVFLVPILSLGFDVPLRAAIAASAISVVANSLSGSRVYLRLRYTNLRLAMLLLVTTTAGATAGGLLAVSLPDAVLKSAFATLLLIIAGIMLSRRTPVMASTVEISQPPDPYRLEGRYADGPVGEVVSYVPVRLGAGLSLSTLAGLASGLFGIGGGPITVPLLNLVMNVPLKAAASTSAFMVGLTASASAIVYYNAGHVDPQIVIPSVLGIVLGARFGARLATRLRPDHLITIFVAVMVLLSVSMYLDAAGVI